MAESDWAALTSGSHGALDSGQAAKGVSAAFSPPPHSGTNSFVVGVRSVGAVTGVAGFMCDVTNYNPLIDSSANQKGGRISAAIKKYSSGFDDYAPFIALQSGLNVQTSEAYILGLSESDPTQIMLRKGALYGGMNPAASDRLRVSDQTFESSEWIHLCLDVLVNPHGEVVLNVFRNDLSANDVDSPTWAAVSGMDQFIDDSLGALTGTAPLISGMRAIFGCYFGGTAGKIALFDQVVVGRQDTP